MKNLFGSNNIFKEVLAQLRAHAKKVDSSTHQFNTATNVNTSTMNHSMLDAMKQHPMLSELNGLGMENHATPAASENKASSKEYQLQLEMAFDKQNQHANTSAPTLSAARAA